MILTHPELLALALPVGWLVLRIYRGLHPVTAILRSLAAAAILLALAGPHYRGAGSGVDRILVIDRSRSMPAETEAQVSERIALLQDSLEPEDRLAVVAFAGDVAIERPPSQAAEWSGFERELPRDDSQLDYALETALGLVPEGKSASILLLSDGETQGLDGTTQARRALARGIPIDVLPALRPAISDLAVERFELPTEVGTGEPFPFGVWVTSDQRRTASYRLLRDGVLLAQGEREFAPGRTRLVFRDRLAATGVARYELILEGAQDRIPENDRGLGALAVRGEQRLLVLNEAGTETPMVAALVGAGLPVVVRQPETFTFAPADLAAFRGVILENVAADRVGRSNMLALRDFVLDRGGGLAMTGGAASFGVGGYHLSPIDELLPVSLEMREEHRKLGIALAIALDRSGSMSQPVGNLTKMDLANQGTAEAIRMLSRLDSVAVLAVDTKAHVVHPMTAVGDPEALIPRVLDIESSGGGIYTYNALLAAAQELREAPQKNRHMILFADAADAEQPEGTEDLLASLTDQGVTLSVIALGSDQDADALFLEELALQGDGQVYFTSDPVDLPRLFAQDTVAAARASLVEEPTGVNLQADLFGLGMPGVESFPTLAGYNLTYLKEEGRLGAVTTDSYRAPILAFAQRGLGRCAAHTAQIGGSLGGELVSWEGFPDWIATLGRWLVGNEEPGAFFPEVLRQGSDALLRVEVDLEAESAPDTSQLRAVLAGPAGQRREVQLERVAAGLFEARIELEEQGIWVGAVALDEERALQLPPMALPYSPEFETPRRSGADLLARLADITGGAIDPSMDRLSTVAPSRSSWRSLRSWFTLAGLVLLLMEIAGRRLSLWNSIQLPERKRRAAKLASEAASANAPATNEAASRQAPPSPAATDQPALGSALARARRKAERRLDR